MANRETSDTLSSLAGKIMGLDHKEDIATRLPYLDLLTSAKRLAGSVLSQDEHAGKRPKVESHEALIEIVRDKLGDLIGLGGGDATTLEAAAEEIVEAIRSAPSAGTTAYEMIAATEKQNIETTEALIHMTAATVLSVLIDEEGGGRLNITFSPHDMDEMNRRYELDAKHDGMITTVSIQPREGMFPKGMSVKTVRTEGEIEITHTSETPPESLYRDRGDDTVPADEQVVEHTYDRPLWAARVDGKLFPASDQAQAERIVASNSNPETIAQVENRFCYHDDCPAEHCNVNGAENVPDQDDASEVTSDS